jgi:phenylalanyl-tRNA synthetase beta chain
VPGIDVTLSVGKIRGVESHGMMCSERELQMSDEHTGIIDLPEDAPVGSSFAAYAGLDDPVIEIGLTPNRPTAPAFYGIARDLAAAGLGKLKTPRRRRPAEGHRRTCPVKVTIEEPIFAPASPAAGRGVKNGPRRNGCSSASSPSACARSTRWSISPTTSPSTGPPAARLRRRQGRRQPRGAPREGRREGARARQREYKLTPEMCVIADDNGVESIAGIMGGEHSGCDENTTDVLIESALWNPMNIARTGRDLGIITDARYRFERGVDPEFMVDGMELATELVLEFCGGTPSEPEVVGYKGLRAEGRRFPLLRGQAADRLEVSPTTSPRDPQGLGFEVSGSGETVKVAVPSWRPDVEGKADLVEEVMRIHGVDNIDPQPLPSHRAASMERS